jgi:hypothetical protein
MKRLLSLTFGLLFLSLLISAQKEGLKSINKSDLKALMTFFASDELEGRETGSRGNNAAALYLKTNLMRIGLQPIPGAGDYYQMIPLRSSQLMPGGNSLKIINENGESNYSTDSLVFLSEPSKSLDVSGNLVFAGYGMEDKESGYSDLKDVDIKDKFILIMTSSARNNDSIEFDAIFNMPYEEPKLRSLFKYGPKNILYVYNPENKFTDPYVSGLANMAVRPGRKMVSINNKQAPLREDQVLFITQQTADMLLQPTGYNLKQMSDKMISSGKPVSVEVKGITSSLTINVESSEFSSPNVIGIIEGSDPVLKNECIIYTAHFDHEGPDMQGEILNGADDNASGSMALLEVAEAFMKLKRKPLRTIIFAWVNGEEEGLLGSRYYTDNPVISMEKTLLDINLDMIGRSKLPSDTTEVMGFDITVTQPGEVLTYYDHESAELDKMLKNAEKQSDIKVIDMGKKLSRGSSDQASFIAKNVPAYLFISGVHSDLHTSRDDVDKIDFDKMEKVSKMVFLLGYQVANKRERIKLNNPE